MDQPRVDVADASVDALEALFGLPDAAGPTYTRPGGPPSPDLTPDPEPDFTPLVTGVPVLSGSQAQGDVLFARTDDQRPYWGQHIAQATITLVASGNGHVLTAKTTGRGRVYWAPGGCPKDPHVIGFIEVVGGPHEAVALIVQPGPDGKGESGHKPLALGEGRYWVCRQMVTTPDLRLVRVID